MTTASLMDPNSIETIPGDVSPELAAFIYGYPLVMTGITQQTVINKSQSDTSGAAPLNQFGKQTQFPDSSFNAVVLPSTSTLYTSAFLNLSQEPMILSLPDFADRFFLMQIFDAWSNVYRKSPGTRLESPKGDYVIVGPDDTTDLSSIDPDFVIRLKTASAWIIGRIYSSGTTDDLNEVRRDIYPHLRLRPWNKLNNSHYVPPQNLPTDPMVDMDNAPTIQLKNMDACSFFGKLAAMMNLNPPAKEDAVMVKILEDLGFVFYKGTVTFDYSILNETQTQALQDGTAQGQALLEDPPGTIPLVNYWQYTTDEKLGHYNIHYLYRAIIARKAFGANQVEDCVYGYSTLDSNGDSLSGKYNYQLTLDPIPPSSEKAFWSVTIYKANGTLVYNQDAVYNNLSYNAIGYPVIQGHAATLEDTDEGGQKISLYLSSTCPDDETSTEFKNWLPLPAATSDDPDPGFIVFLRMYMPGETVINGDWIPAGIKLSSHTKPFGVGPP